MTLLVRPHAWWYNKVPLSVLLVLLLLDGERFTWGALAVLALIVGAVCAVGNYGYALNDLYDIDEDARLGRPNAAARAGRRTMWAIILGSAIGAETCAFGAAGPWGILVTTLALCLPLAYSIPPVRVKERRWLGVCADGLAAHVFPATLALIAVAHWALRPIPPGLAACVVAWSAAAGLRGILSHQLHTADQDAGAGLATVVHAHGRRTVERAVLYGILPLELVAFAGAIVLCDGGPVLWAFVGLYLAFEAFKTLDGRFRVNALRREGQAYVPFLEEGWYKVWGPIAFAADAARVDPLYLATIPVYAVLFRAHFRAEWYRLHAGLNAVRPAKAPSARSSGGS